MFYVNDKTMVYLFKIYPRSFFNCNIESFIDTLGDERGSYYFFQFYLSKGYDETAYLNWMEDLNKLSVSEVAFRFKEAW